MDHLHFQLSLSQSLIFKFSFSTPLISVLKPFKCWTLYPMKQVIQWVLALLLFFLNQILCPQILLYFLISLRKTLLLFSHCHHFWAFTHIRLNNSKRFLIFPCLVHSLDALPCSESQINPLPDPFLCYPKICKQSILYQLISHTDIFSHWL